MIVGNQTVRTQSQSQDNIFTDYALYEQKMLIRRKKLLQLYTQELYQYKEDLARIGYDLVIDKSRWRYETML